MHTQVRCQPSRFVSAVQHQAMCVSLAMSWITQHGAIKSAVSAMVGVAVDRTRQHAFKKYDVFYLRWAALSKHDMPEPLLYVHFLDTESVFMHRNVQPRELEQQLLDSNCLWSHRSAPKITCRVCRSLDLSVCIVCLCFCFRFCFCLSLSLSPISLSLSPSFSPSLSVVLSPSLSCVHKGVTRCAEADTSTQD